LKRFSFTTSLVTAEKKVPQLPSRFLEVPSNFPDFHVGTITYNESNPTSSSKACLERDSTKAKTAPAQAAAELFLRRHAIVWRRRPAHSLSPPTPPTTSPPSAPPPPHRRRRYEPPIRHPIVDVRPPARRRGRTKNKVRLHSVRAYGRWHRRVSF